MKKSVILLTAMLLWASMAFAGQMPVPKSYVDSKVPKTTTVNGHPLSTNITVTKDDVGLGNVPNVDTTNASNISSGTLNHAQLPTLTQSDIQAAIQAIMASLPGLWVGYTGPTPPDAPTIALYQAVFGSGVTIAYNPTTATGKGLFDSVTNVDTVSNVDLIH